MINLNKPGSGKELLKKIQMHPGLASNNSTRKKQHTIFQQQQKIRQRNRNA